MILPLLLVGYPTTNCKQGVVVTLKKKDRCFVKYIYKPLDLSSDQSQKKQRLLLYQSRKVIIKSRQCTLENCSDHKLILAQFGIRAK